MINKVVVASLGVTLVLAVATWQLAKPTEVKKAKLVNGSINSWCLPDFCIKNNNGNWQMTSGTTALPAESDKAESLAKSLATFDTGTVVSKSSENSEIYGLTNGCAINVNNQKISIGKIGPDYSSIYVKTDNSNDVYLENAALDQSQICQSSYWENKTVTNLALYQISKVEIKFNGKTTTLTPKSDATFDHQSLVEKAAHLTATSYLTEKPTTESSSEIQLTVDNQTTELLIGKVTANKKIVYWASTDKNNYYEIDQADYSQLTSL